MRTYRLREISVDDATDDTLAHHPPLVRQLLRGRGITTAGAADRFLNPDYELHQHDPFLLTDMRQAVDRILLAIQEGQHIVIYTDYDCDGIPGGVLLHDFFTAINYSNFENYIPHRHHEGYGFNAASIEAFVERNTKLIITVDCGIVDHEAAEKAQSLGIDVVITDHHEPSATLPPAFAVINPKRDSAYPFNGLCGTGVAFKLVQALIREGRERGVFELKDGWEKWWLDMVGIATIADMVPLVDENRVLARYGISVLRKSRRPGLQQLLRTAGGDQRFLTEDDIGFTIAPRINAASRMDNPEDAFHMLRTTDEGEAGEYVRHLEKLNNERKGVVAAMTKEIKKRLHLMADLPQVLVLGNPEWRPSLVGLAANGLVEEVGRPVFLWGRDGRGVLKGSCRSEGVTSTLRLMERVRELFIEFGGHHFSGGFSVHETHIHRLPDALNEAYVAHTEAARAEPEMLSIDADLSLGDITDSLLNTLALLAPYGEGNPKPLFRFQSVVPRSVIQFGKGNDHTKLVFGAPHGPQEAIAFFKTPEQFETVPEVGKPMTLIGHVEASYFRGRKSTRIRIVDLLP